MASSASDGGCCEPVMPSALIMNWDRHDEQQGKWKHGHSEGRELALQAGGIEIEIENLKVTLMTSKFRNSHPSSLFVVICPTATGSFIFAGHHSPCIKLLKLHENQVFQVIGGLSFHSVILSNPQL